MSRNEKMNKRGVTYSNPTKDRSYTMLLLLLGTSFLIALLLFPHLLIPAHQYLVGDVVQKDIKSPKDFLVEDKEATEKKRQEVAGSILTVYDLDDELSSKLSRQVMEAFGHMRRLIEENMTASPIDEVELSEPVEDQAELMIADAAVAGTVPVHDLLLQEKQGFEAMLGLEVSPEAFRIIEEDGFSESMVNQISLLLQTVLQNGVVANKQLLLLERDKGIIVRRLSSKQEEPVGNLKRFFSIEEARKATAKSGQDLLKEVNRPTRNFVVETAQRLVQPNLTLNKGETEERKQRAVQEVKAVLTQIKQGEMLLREGEKVTAADMVRLQALNTETGRQPILTSSLGFMILTVTFFIILFNVTFNTRGDTAFNSKDLLFLCLMLVVLFFMSHVAVSLAEGIAVNMPDSVRPSSLFYAIPVVTGPMVVCLFMGLRISLPFALAMAFFAAFLFESRFDMFVFFLLSGIMGAYWVRSCRERGTLIKAGLKVGLVNILLVTGLHTANGAGLELKLIGDWVFGLLGGLSAGILATGFAPVVEMMFGYATDIKLLELANLDRPILRKLMLEAPGTYHHSVIVGSLVEAAAATIGANPLLSKVSGYYHDIGKIKKPLYFIENQARGQNRHDKLAPSMSSLILTAHVKDGVEIAKNHRLGKAIIDAIQQHHGTSLIRYFCEKAIQLKGADAVNIEHFRYPGPKPQTKEAGLVLLADSVEAASRSLENPTPARIRGLVQKIINKIFLDGQLDECELTLRDLHEIAKSFNKILNGIHHHRIDYPREVAPVVNGGTVNGHSDKRQTKSLQDRLPGGPEEGEANLRRLGMS
ncbi:MAG: HDIG domain-containing protein [Deltaproteobacteria bacterium]|nr:HDIG domain-containing protein [Deltaproteobacteria bacterium]